MPTHNLENKNKCLLLYLTKIYGWLFYSIIVEQITDNSLQSKSIFLLTAYFVENYWVIHFASKLYRFASLSFIVRFWLLLLVRLWFPLGITSYLQVGSLISILFMNFFIFLIFYYILYFLEFFPPFFFPKDKIQSFFLLHL